MSGSKRMESKVYAVGFQDSTDHKLVDRLLVAHRQAAPGHYRSEIPEYRVGDRSYRIEAVNGDIEIRRVK